MRTARAPAASIASMQAREVNRLCKTVTLAPGFVACSLAKSAGEMRSARELTAFASVLGMTDVERKDAEKNLARLIGAVKVEK